jgi:hypothetical protein
VYEVRGKAAGGETKSVVMRRAGSRASSAGGRSGVPPDANRIRPGAAIGERASVVRASGAKQETGTSSSDVDGSVPAKEGDEK